MPDLPVSTHSAEHISATPKQTDTRKVAPEYRVILWLAALGFFMQALDATIVNTALPSIAHSLRVNPLQMHNVVVAYVLTVAALIPASGWLADRFGIKNIYLAAIAIFTLASLLCGFAQSYEQLIVGRVLQGVGGAFLLPVGRLALLRILPREQFLAAMGFIAIPGLVGPMIGPALGGFLVEYASWHWIFWINLPIGLLGMMFTLSHMPNVTLPDLPPFDYQGFMLLAVAMISLTLGLEQLSQGNSWLWIGVILTIGLCSTLIYTRHAMRDSRAIFRADLFGDVGFRLGILGNVFTRLGSGAMPFILPLTLQLGLGFSPFQSGLMLMPMVLGAMTIKRTATAAIRRFGYYRVLAVNTVLVGVGIMSFTLLQWHGNVYTQSVHLFLFGCVNSMQFTAMNTLTLKNLTQAQSANGNSLLSMVINLCMSMSIACAGVLLHGLHVYAPEQGVLWAFQGCYVILGGMTILATLIFRRLKDAPQFA